MAERPADIYTLEGLAWLTAELAHKEAQWDNYSGNNPNKGAAHRQALRAQVEVVTSSLEAQGLIALSEAELLKRSLDRQTPGRLNGCCTQLDGHWYKIKFTGKDSRGFWDWTWTLISEEEANRPGGYIHPGA